VRFGKLDAKLKENCSSGTAGELPNCFIKKCTELGLEEGCRHENLLRRQARAAPDGVVGFDGKYLR
jgi:hypothetical protein